MQEKIEKIIGAILRRFGYTKERCDAKILTSQYTIFAAQHDSAKANHSQIKFVREQVFNELLLMAGGFIEIEETPTENNGCLIKGKLYICKKK